jgi:AcrR family transcriptional regulator
VTFQRARSDEQREVRRRDILDVAGAMLDEMPVSEISLNELSRRVGLAKSNVLRYFESREAVLLELLDRAGREWVDAVVAELSAIAEPGRPVAERGERLAAVLARSLVQRPVLCDLMSAQPGVLEHNVSVDVVVRIKRSGLRTVDALATAVRGQVPELGEDAEGLCLMAVILAGALWAHGRAAPSVLEAFRVDPALARLCIDVPFVLERTIATLIAGTLSGRGAAGARRPAAPRRRG